MFDLAIYYRMVGGFVGTGSTQLARLRWSFTMGCYMALLSMVHHEGYTQAALVFVACALGAFLGRLISHSRFQATASAINSLGMAVMTMLRLALLVLPYSITSMATVSGLQPWRLLLVLFGMGAGIAYFIGNKYLAGKDSGIYYRNNHGQWRINSANGVSNAIDTDQSQFLDQAAVGGSEWGELLTGWLAYELMFVFALVLV